MKQERIHSTACKAHAKYLWMSPTKVRRVLPHLKHKSVQDVLAILPHVSHRSSLQLRNLIQSAQANYMQKFPQADPSTLYLKNLYVDEGPRVKRLWRRGRGRADILLKRMCHITALVDTRIVKSPKKGASSANKKELATTKVQTGQSHPATNTTKETVHNESSVGKRDANNTGSTESSN